MNPSFKSANYQPQLNPHFVFNSLNHLQYYINEGDKRAALSYLTRFSRFMRQWLLHAAEVEMPLTEEVALMEQYLALESLRFGASFQYKISQEISFKDEMLVPSLLMYPVIEQALYQCVLAKEIKGHIRLNFTLLDGEPVCIVNVGYPEQHGGKNNPDTELTIHLGRKNKPQSICNA